MKRNSRLILCIALVLTFSTWVATAQEVTYWLWGWAPEMLVGVHAAIDLFEGENPGITVNRRVGVSLDQLLTATAAGVPPDLVLGTSTLFESMLLLDGLEPLDRRFAEANLWDYLLPGLEVTTQYRGIEYGVPGVALYPLDGLVWNKTMFAESGLHPLDGDRAITWDELAELSRKLVRRSSDDVLTCNGYHPLEGRNSNPDVLEAYFNLTLITDGTPQLNTPEVAAALEFLNDNFILSQGRSAEELLAFSPGGWYLIGQGRTAIANLGSYAPAELGSRAPDHEFGVTWHPTPDGTKKQQITTFINMIPRGAANVDAAWKLAEFLATSAEAQALIFGSTAFFGPSQEFISDYGFDNPLTRWYMASLSEAESAAFETYFKYGEGIPNVWNFLTDAKRAVLVDQEPAASALERANHEWMAEILRTAGE